MTQEKLCILNQNSGARATLDLITNKWAVLVLYALQEGTQRFGELHRQVEGITQKMLIQTLRHLERDGLVGRKVYAVVPPKVEYYLTPLGKTLRELLLAICNWSDQHLQDVETARIVYDNQLKSDERST